VTEGGEHGGPGKKQRKNRIKRFDAARTEVGEKKYRGGERRCSEEQWRRRSNGLPKGGSSPSHQEPKKGGGGDTFRHAQKWSTKTGHTKRRE